MLWDGGFFSLWRGWGGLTFDKSCYNNSTELLFAAMSLYQMRVIERLWGSRKFAVCIWYSTLCLGMFRAGLMRVLGSLSSAVFFLRP